MDSVICKLKLLLLAITFALVTSYASTSYAQDDAMGFETYISGTAVLGDGTEVAVNFPLAFEQDNSVWYFRAGNQRVAMYLPPSQYNLQFAVQENDSMVYLPELSNRYMRSFKVTIGDHELELIPTAVAKYGVRLRIDDRMMMFDRRTPSVSIQLDGYGITGYRAEGFIRDLSIRRVE